MLVGKILNCKKGDLIAVPPITFLSSVNVIEHCNAKPIFCDVQEDTFQMDPNHVKKLITISFTGFIGNVMIALDDNIPSLTVKVKLSEPLKFSSGL